MHSLNASSLGGLWAAIPTPFTAGDSIDFPVLRDNVKRLASAGVDGIYTTDSDGEFYAIELAEFQTLATEFGAAMRAVGLPAQMGATWVNTKGVIDRIKAGLDAGIDMFHVALPFFMPLSLADVHRFFSDLATAAPEGRWIYYAHPNCLPLLKGQELAKLAVEFPENLIGTKLNAYELGDLTDVSMHAPHLAHFGGEKNLWFGGQLGLKGCYSYWVNTMPKWTREFYTACLQGDYLRARNMHLKLQYWETVNLAEIRRQGFRFGVLGKAKGALTGFLDGDGSTRRPYQAVPAALLDGLKDQFRSYWREELERE